MSAPVQDRQERRWDRRTRTLMALGFAVALVLAVWVAGGAMLGAAFYRNGVLGLALLPVALAAVMFIESATGPGHVGPLPVPLLGVAGLEPGPVSPLGAAGWSLTCVAALAGATWPIVRDVPIRTQAP